MKPLRSMTGYASAHTVLVGAPGQCEGLRMHIELRAVNGRFLDLSLRCPDDWRSLEAALREQITARVARGKLECRLFRGSDPPATPVPCVIDTVQLDALINAQNMIRAQCPQASPLSVHELLSWPGVRRETVVQAQDFTQQALDLMRTVLDAFIASRAREGEKLGAALLERAQRMRALITQLAPLLPQVLADYEQRIRDRWHDVVDARDDERIRQEIALIAMRLDVSEEIARLQAHLDELHRIVDGGGVVGKRLDFLAQELNREANTLASKSLSTGITAIALELKLLIEQVREQVQNLE
jgi:uncharacterized protein (TIGR00255 family)